MNTIKLLLKSPKFIIGFCLFMFLFLTAFIYPAVSTKDPLDMVGFMYEPPSSTFLLGTDNFGRDVFVELIHGMKSSLIIGLISGVIATAIGITIGLFAGYKGGTVDNILNSITNIFLVIPPFIILILITVSLKSRSLGVMGLVLGITSWPWTARAVRAQTLSLRNREHVDIARLNGASTVEIIIREIMPYILSYIFMAFILQVATGILNEAGISMLGLGPSNIVSLGTMLSWALLFESVRSGAWWAFISPSIAIALITFSLYIMNSGMDEIFNPKLRS
ncbi:ABC transporter permease [Petrotoga sp. 9PWA.NaAc.5.4]|uniref:ABC transporter permease n=1 Tax=Petrotoga sp. 9PWA.NaAc.5.4 TaxID=1434328 RepID=UPI000CC7EE07|nr:ABC transporter permease [Petrotoga sp. 9PWA.NaAc.5.4]PNR96213.1 ABC transporter permease [Petrotoga sp. 9PWA.NaAc.5.4]